MPTTSRLRAPCRDARDTTPTHRIQVRPYLFVYGTLRQTHRHTHQRLLRPARFIARGSIFGTLYDLGQYPGVHKTSRRIGRVAGELYELTGEDLGGRLAALDRYEGSDFYRARVLVQLQNGGRHFAWAYILANGPPQGAPEIQSGVFRRRVSRSRVTRRHI